MSEHKFKLNAPFKPAGDQPQAIKQLLDGIDQDERHQVLLGVTGSSKLCAIRWLFKYLCGAMNKGASHKPDPGEGLEACVDADFAGNWDPKETGDRSTARSRHGHAIMYEGCPIVWKSQLQGEIALSSTHFE